MAEDCLAGAPPCFNLFESIPSASFFTLLNLFGEFPCRAAQRLDRRDVCVQVHVWRSRASAATRTVRACLTHTVLCVLRVAVALCVLCVLCVR